MYGYLIRRSMYESRWIVWVFCDNFVWVLLGGRVLMHDLSATL